MRMIDPLKIKILRLIGKLIEFAFYREQEVEKVSNFYKNSIKLK